MRLHLLLLGLLLACGGSSSDDCKSTPSYAADIQPLIEQRCLGCHSAELMGLDRQGAPENLNFNSYALIMTAGISSFADAFTSGRMPPINLDPPITTTKEERATVSRWRMCNYPE